MLLNGNLTIKGDLTVEGATSGISVEETDQAQLLQNILQTLGSNLINPNGTINSEALNASMSNILPEALDGNATLHDLLVLLASADINVTSSTNRYQTTFSGQSSYTVTHNLESLYCSVDVIEGTNRLSPTEYTVQYLSTNTLRITFNSAKNVTVVVIG